MGEVEEGFSVDDFFEGSFGIFAGGEREEVVIDFAPEVAHLVKARRWHSSQKIAGPKGGGVRMRLEVVPTPDVVRWVVGWGLWATVSHPTSLAEEVTHEHTAVLRMSD